MLAVPKGAKTLMSSSSCSDNTLCCLFTVDTGRKNAYTDLTSASEYRREAAGQDNVGRDYCEADEDSDNTTGNGGDTDAFDSRNRHCLGAAGYTLLHDRRDIESGFEINGGGAVGSNSASLCAHHHHGLRHGSSICSNGSRHCCETKDGPPQGCPSS